MFFPEHVWVPGSNQTRRCTSWAWRRTTRTGSVQCWGFFYEFLWVIEVISNILTKSWVNIKMRVEHLKAGGGGPHHQAGTKPRGGHPAPQVSYSVKIVSGFQKDWIMIATKLKLNIFAKIYKDFLFVRTAMLIGSSKEHIWKNFDLWSLFGFGLRSSPTPHHSAQRYDQFWCFPKDWCMSSFKTEERHSSFIDHILNGGSILLKFPDTLFEESAREPDETNSIHPLVFDGSNKKFPSPIFISVHMISIQIVYNM